MHTSTNEFNINIAHHHDGAARKQWWIVVGLGILALVLGTHGFLHQPESGGGQMDLLDAVYQSMRLFHMHCETVPHPLPLELQIARFLAPMVLGFTLVKGFIFVAHGHRRAFLQGSQSGHIVICGLGQKGLQLAKEYRDKKESVVVIEKDPNNELLAACDVAGVFYWIGDAAEPAVLARARVAEAKEVVIITPEDETNVRIAVQVRNLVTPKSSKRPECFVHLENIHLRERLQKLHGNNPAQPTGFALRFFDVYDNEARRVLLELPLDGTGIGKDDPRSVHVVILGFGRMGRSISLRAAKIGHFANGKLLRISVIDRSADRQREHFLFRYPVLEKQTGNQAICQLQFHQAEAQSLQARKLIAGWAAEPHTILHLFVCMDDNARAVEVGLRLQEMLAGRPDCNLRVRIKTSTSLADIISFPPEIVSPRIVAFGMVEDACCDRAFRHESNEGIARYGHDEFIKHRLADSIRTPENDPALLPWDKLAEDLRESSRQQADHIAIKLRAIGCEIAAKDSDARDAITKFTTADIELLAELEHTRWNAERWLAGWRYGPPGRKSERISPHLGPWQDLHDSIQKYDRDAIVEIPGRLAGAKPPLKVVRK